MNLSKYFLLILLVVIHLSGVSNANAATAATTLEQSLSQTLDLWREGQYEQLYERLSHRGRTSREQFVSRMREAARRPACCWQKIENFRVLNEKRTEATVYAKIGLEGTPSPVESCTREFKLSHDANEWKVQLSDIFYLAGITSKKSKNSSYGYNKKNSRKTSANQF
ncbi:MAG TPA: hypothetical protein VGJ93_15470 [Desulfuromonadaceae bacterium]|jgi:hypothetical protein